MTSPPVPLPPEKLSEFLDVIEILTQELDLDRLLQLIMEKASTVMGADRSTLFMVDAERRELWSKVAQEVDLREIRIPIGQGIAGAVAATGETINIPEAYRDPRFDPGVDRKTGYTTRSILCAPVRDAQGEIVGVAQVLNKTGGAFTREDAELLGALAAQAFIALDNARLFEAVVYMKSYNESILRCMATGVMTLDSAGRAVSVNPAFQKIFGLPGDVPLGTDVTQFLDREGNEAIVRRLHDCAVRGEAYDGFDLKYVPPSGESVSLNLSVVPLQDSKKNPLGIVAVAEDIT